MKKRLLICFTLAFVAGLAIVAGACGNNYRIQGKSMEPTLKEGRSYTTSAYKSQLPERGDIVVYQAPGSTVPRVSRVIGLPGEQVQVKDGLVYIGGVRLDEPYVMPSSRTGPAADYAVPDGSVLLLSDNREAAQDSRVLGFIPVEALKGRIAATTSQSP